MRAEAVERAQAGDRCDFTGTLIVVPDVAAINLPGARAESSSRHAGGKGWNCSPSKLLMKHIVYIVSNFSVLINLFY